MENLNSKVIFALTLLGLTSLPLVGAAVPNQEGHQLIQQKNQTPPAILETKDLKGAPLLAEGPKTKPEAKPKVNAEAKEAPKAEPEKKEADQEKVDESQKDKKSSKKKRKTKPKSRKDEKAKEEEKPKSMPPAEEAPQAEALLDDDDEKSIEDKVPEGVELINISFPEPTDIKDIIKAVSMWNEKTIILDDRSISGKVQILSSKDTTKEEAYQIFLEALNTVGLTTVETIDIIKVVKHANAKRDNLPTYHGNSWAPRTGEFITQVVPLKYVLAKDVSLILSRMFPTNSIIAYEPTNTLIVSDTGNQIQRILDILALLDVQKQQPKIMIVPIKYSDPKTVASKVKEILKGQSSLASSSGYNSFKILTDDRTSSVIIFGPPRTLDDIKKLVKTFDIEVADPAMEATIHVRPLNYADAKDLSSTLSSLIDSGGKNTRKYSSDIYSSSSTSSSSGEASVAALSEGVKISADEATNSLIITGSRAAYNALNVIIRKLDKQRSQVYIKVDIIEMTSRDDFNFGMSLLGAAGMQEGQPLGSIFGFNADSGASSLLGAQALAAGDKGVSIDALKAIKDTFSSNLKVGLLGPSLSIPGLGDNIRPGLLIDILKTDGNSKILQTPQILTQNNAEATVVVGEKRTYKTDSQNANGIVSSKVEKEDVDLTLTIKPHISSYSDFVTMNINLDANNITGKDPTTNAPEVAKRKTKQLVTVKNNQTVVISGLLSQEESETFSKIPLLGDIPLIGMLFRKSRTEKKQKNLIMFITPHVIHGPGDLAAIYKAKLDERDEFMKKVYGKSIMNSEFYRLMPGYKHGMYNPTEQEKIEDMRRDKERKETLEVMGYTKEKSKPKSPFKDSVERTVPIPLEIKRDDEAANEAK